MQGVGDAEGQAHLGAVEEVGKDPPNTMYPRMAWQNCLTALHLRELQSCCKQQGVVRVGEASRHLRSCPRHPEGQDFSSGRSWAQWDRLSVPEEQGLSGVINSRGLVSRPTKLL